MIARSDYVFTRSGGRSGRENSLGSAVPRTAVRLFELCMDTACLQRVLFAVRDSDSSERRCTYDADVQKQVESRVAREPRQRLSSGLFDCNLHALLISFTYIHC